ncbi:MAG: helix-turn-helix domain-containing protein [Pseudonocardiaceae bacterium]
MRPTVRSRRLGAQLRTYRETARLDQTKVAGTIGIKQAHMSSIENGRTKLSAEKLATLAEVLRIPAETAARMEDLRARAHVPGWWQDYGDILAEPVQALIELEEDASWIKSFDGQVVQGLLQIREYAEQIITASAPHLRVGDIDRYLELRMRRQQCLTRGIRLTAIMSEAAVRQQIGGPALLREQLCHLTRTVREHDVTVQVVPFTAGAHAALCDQFEIIQWPLETDPEAVYVDGQTSWMVHEGNRAVRQYNHALTSVQSQALSTPDSIELINNLIKELPT